MYDKLGYDTAQYTPQQCNVRSLYSLSLRWSTPCLQSNGP